MSKRINWHGIITKAGFKTEREYFVEMFGKYSVDSLSRITGVSPATFYRRGLIHGLRKPPSQGRKKKMILPPEDYHEKKPVLNYECIGCGHKNYHRTCSECGDECERWR